MKKLVLIASVFGLLVMGVCAKSSDNVVTTPEACHQRMEKWHNFDKLSADEQKSLVKEMKAAVDKREADREAARKEFEKKWKKFDKLSVEEQKALLDQKMHHGRHHHGMHQGAFKHHGPKGPQCGAPQHDCPQHRGPRPECPMPQGPAPAPAN